MTIQSTKKDIRTWALVLAAAFTVVGGVQYLGWGHVRTATIFWILAAFFLLSGLLIPTILKPIYWLWLKFAAALAWFNTRLIMGLMFFLVFTPIGLVLRLLRIDLIKQRWDSKASSYWIPRSDDPFDPSRYENQY